MLRDVLPEAFAASDVFVFPSLGDPYGLVVDEAMASGLPIVASAAAGEIDVRVKNDVNGYIVPPSDSSTLRDRMEWFTSNQDAGVQMGEQSRILIANNTPDNFAQNFEHAIYSMLGQDDLTASAA
jgi:glycosyltransferase involved in cell wall biosynthesis